MDKRQDYITWDEYFMNQAIETMASIKRYYNAAVEAGVELTPDAETQIEETLNSYKTYLGNYSLSSFLEMQFGKGVNEKLFRKVLGQHQTHGAAQSFLHGQLAPDAAHFAAHQRF